MLMCGINVAPIYSPAAGAPASTAAPISAAMRPALPLLAFRYSAGLGLGLASKVSFACCCMLSTCPLVGAYMSYFAAHVKEHVQNLSITSLKAVLNMSKTVHRHVQNISIDMSTTVHKPVQNLSIWMSNVRQRHTSDAIYSATLL